MNRVDHLLVCLAEECSETAQRATKMLRFGPEEIQPSQELDNTERVVLEFNDIMAIMEMLMDEGVIPPGFIRPVLILKKKNRVEKMLLRSKECGRLV